ncbi:MAG: EpsG family protein [Bergeyella sp.]|nr:EpsG family protein [Bergeyella sp.]
MYLYIIYFIFSFLSFLEIGGGRKITRKLFFLSLFLLFLLSCLRWDRGTDWEAYLDIFNGIENVFYLKTYEPGFYFLNYFVREFTNNYTWMLAAQSVIIYSLSYYIIKKYSWSGFISLTVWFGFLIGSVFFVRFHVALTFIFFSIIYIRDRKFWKFLLCVVLASLFHRTSILFIPAYFVYNKNFSRKFFMIAIIFSFLLGTVFKNGLIYLSELSFGMFSEKAIAYLTGDDKELLGDRSAVGIMIVGFSYRILLMGLILAFYYQLYKNDVFFRGLINIYLIGICLFIIVTPVSVPMARMSIFYEYFQILFVPYLVLWKKISRLKGLILFFVVLFYFARLVNNIAAYEDRFIPYKSIITL